MQNNFYIDLICRRHFNIQWSRGKYSEWRLFSEW